MIVRISEDDQVCSSRIVSWYEIVKTFYAGRYLNALNALSNLFHVLERSGNALDPTLREILPNTLGAFETIVKDCEALELAASLRTAQKVVTFFKGETLKSHVLKELIDEFRGRIADELFARECFLLTLQEARRFKKPLDGWESIAERFPQATRDIEEAWKCFAVSRYTAAVFHSVQVVETGVIELGAFIGVNDPFSNWISVTKRLKQILDENYKNLDPDLQPHREFLEQVHGTVEALKNAWRNKVSHVGQRLVLMRGEEFHPDIAEEILMATRAFMRRLGDGLPVVENTSVSSDS